MIFGERLVVPADHPANLVPLGVDPAGGVMRRRDAAGDPVIEPAERPQLVRHGPNRRPSLTFQLEDVELGDAARGPEIGRQPDVGDRVAVEIEGEALDAGRAEIPSGEDGVGGDVAQGIGHGRASRGERSGAGVRICAVGRLSAGTELSHRDTPAE